METTTQIPSVKHKLKAAIFDFDGTISTLRCGWEEIMREMMVSEFKAVGLEGEEIVKTIEDYIDSSAGLQTYYQMEWLANEIAAITGNKEVAKDPWDYKDIYAGMLIESVKNRIADIEQGRQSADTYMVAGSREFIKAVKDAGLKLYIASGTDEVDVRHEASILGVAEYFDGIAGAPSRQASCSKEKVLRQLTEESGYEGQELVIIGDGRVEIQLGKELNCVTVGVASNEETGEGINPAKINRLQRAGAEIMIGDFTHPAELLKLLNIGE